MFCFKSKIFQNWTRAREKITKNYKITNLFFLRQMQIFSVSMAKVNTH